MLATKALHRPETPGDGALSSALIVSTYLSTDCEVSERPKFYLQSDDQF